MTRTIGIAVLLALIAAVAVLVARSRWTDAQRAVGPEAEAERNPFDVRPRGKRPTAEPAYDHTAVVEKFCTTCHVLPPADCEPKDQWPSRIRQMYGYAQRERPVPLADIPPIRVPIEYFMARAPDYLEVPQDAMGSPPSPLAFARHGITLDAIPSPPAISSVKFVKLSDDAPTQLLICDMRHGLVVLWTPSRPHQPAKVIGRVAHPSHTHVVDLDGDGLRDVLVANLGVLWPLDTSDGSVVWLRGRGNDRFDSIVLLKGVNRVNDVQTGDFDS